MDRKITLTATTSILFLIIAIIVTVPFTYASEWSPDMRLTTDDDIDWFPSITSTTDGSLWVVWRSDRTGDDEIFYKVYDGTSWSNDTQVTTDSNAQDWDPSAMQTADGQIWVAFTKTPIGKKHSDIYYKVFNGSSWTRDFRLTFEDKHYDQNPSIMETINGTIWVVWDSDRDLFYNKLYYKFFNGSTWSGDTKLTTYLADDMYPSITQATDHTIWVVWGSVREAPNFDIYYKTMIPHDVAITEVTVPVDPVIRGETISLNVTAMNRGTESETFTVQSYANSTLVGSETISLTPEQSQSLTFQWNTTGVPSGTYIISATAVAVLGEENLDDNYLIGGSIEVRILGDICGWYGGSLLPIPDGRVELDDFMIAVGQFGTTSSNWHPVWGPASDINEDNVIDIDDLMIIALHFGET